MKKDIAEKWVAALRSGRYTQLQGYLGQGDTQRCCLGVLCDLMPDVEVVEGTMEAGGMRLTVRKYDGLDKVLPYTVREWAGLQDNSAVPYKKEIEEAAQVNIGEEFYENLAEANDRGVTFAEIADWIEKNYEQL